MNIDDIRKARKQLVAMPQNLDQFTVTITETWTATEFKRVCRDASGKVLWSQSGPNDCVVLFSNPGPDGYPWSENKEGL